MNINTFIFYSHSDCRDTWSILKDNLSILPKDQPKIIAVNKGADLSELQDSFNKIIQYEDNLTYPQKVCHILNNISTKYVTFIHDNDLVMSFNNNNFNELLNIIDSNKIDRCMFGIVLKDNPDIVTNDFSIGKINNKTPLYYFIPYDVGPSIWNRQSFINALSTVLNSTYRDIEYSSIQQYCNNNLNMWAFFSHPSKESRYCIGRPFLETFQFLHIFVRGKLLEDHLYMDQQTNLQYLKSKYPAIINRGVLFDQNHIDINRRLV